MSFFPGGYIIFWVLCFDESIFLSRVEGRGFHVEGEGTMSRVEGNIDWVNVVFAACFILRGHDTHIDFLRLLFLVGMICPLMQEHFLRPLLKRKSLPFRLNKSFRLFILIQSASWIAKGDILLSVNVMVSGRSFPGISFNFCHAGPGSFSIFCRMLNFPRSKFRRMD